MLERGYESTFLDIPSAQGALDEARYLNTSSHYAGTWGDHQAAIYMRDKLASYGFTATLETFPARVDTPKKLQLELLSRPRQRFELKETTDPSDPDTGRSDAGLPFNYGSGDGDVIAPLTYVNRGLDEDYAVLEAAKVSVRGKIALIRYGAQFRGLLAKRAQDHGAAGVIFYSDPKDDGFARGPVFPDGPYRPAAAVQRGSVENARMGLPQLRIPSLPVSATTASALLSDMTGAGAPPSWDGALSAPYALGQTKSNVHLSVLMHRSIQTLWNTVGKLPGTTPSQSVILGGHRDAWVYGVTDNGSGISTLLEAARGLGYLHRTGWKPKRTIIIAGFDAEEIGELGSIEYVRAHQNELREGCIAYVNADENVSGSQFGATGAAALTADLIGAARTISDPSTTGIPLFDRWLKDSKAESHNRYLTLPTVHTPGGGSDHESFLFELGTPVAEVGFFGPLGVYHSAYDDLKFARTIADPQFTLHRTAAQLLGLIALRLADSEALPYRFSPYAPVLREGAAAIEATAISAGQHPDVRALRLAIERFAVASRSFDRNPAAHAAIAVLQAAQLVDLQAYGAVGYASTAFPKLTVAIAQNNPSVTNAAFAQAIDSLDRAAGLLR
jgi:N-acetylated-alpha-linked acidic dipeptidase